MRFCGLFASDHRHLKCAVAVVSQVCKTETRTRGRVGVGYYSGNEVLLMRRPVGIELNILQMIGPASGNHVLFGVDDSPSTQFRLESTPPFRFRRHLGLVSFGPVRHPEFAKRVLFHVPDYLARSARSELPGELLFLLYLSYLHDMGRIDSGSVAPTLLIDAVRSTFLLIPKLLDGPAPPAAMCISNGEHLVAAAQGTDLWIRTSQGIEACPVCSTDKPVGHPDVRMVALAHIQSSDPHPGFMPVQPGDIVAVTSEGEVLSRPMNQGRGL